MYKEATTEEAQSWRRIRMSLAIGAIEAAIKSIPDEWRFRALQYLEQRMRELRMTPPEPPACAARSIPHVNR